MSSLSDFDPNEQMQWLYKATKFTFARKAPNMCQTVDDYPVTIEACEQRDGSVLWAVRQFGNCLRTDGFWELECLPSSRDSEWIRLHRFPYKEVAYAAMLAARRTDE